jgi:hypothetical protein
MKITPKKLVSSFQTFATYTNEKQDIPKQSIKAIGKFIVRGNTRKCCVCKGIPRIRIDKKLQGFYPVSIPYPHKANCKNS